MPKGTRMTHGEFVKKVTDQYNGEIEIIGKFTRTKDKITVRHSCGYVWDVIANSISNQSAGCPKCASNAKCSHADFLDKVRNKYGDDVVVLSFYESSSKKIKIRFSCGHENLVLASDVLSGHGCKYCKSRKSEDDYRSDLFKRWGNEYSLVGSYETSYAKTLHRHNVCGFVWDVRPNALLSGHTCRRCASNKLTHNEYVKRVFKIHGSEITVLEAYRSIYSKVVHKHSCGHEWRTTPKLILNGRSCPVCFGSIKKTKEQYNEEILTRFNGEYSLVGDYEGASVKSLHLHERCQNTWFIKPNSLLSGYGCPFCRESKGEKLVAKILKERNIQFERQSKIEGCKNKRKLPFDFIIKDNQTIKLVIEWDGRQHFEPVVSYGGEDGHLTAVYNDKIKNEFCANRNIPLLRIPYWTHKKEVEKMIEDALEAAL